MIRIVNGRDAAGRYFSVELVGHTFTKFQSQAAPLAPVDSGHWQTLGDLVASSGSSSLDATWPDGTTFDAAGAMILPAGVDVHIHSRDPGLTHKEDWHTVTRGAYRGGVAAVADMPNTIPPTMTREAVLEKSRLARSAGIDFQLFLGVGAGNIHRVSELLMDPELPLCGLKVFYGRTTGDLMYDDLEMLSRSLPADGSKIIVFHSEDQCGVDHNHARHTAELERHDPAAFAVHSVIRSSETAHASTRTILHWAQTSYRRPIHIAHVSTPLEVEMMAEAKALGVPVTCEVAPHHVLLSTDDYQRLGPLAKMNPPLRSPDEVAQLRRLVGSGAVDIFATDHAPHALSEKRTTVARSPSGVPSLEFYYPLIFQVIRETGLDPLKAVTMAAERPAALFRFAGRGRIAEGYRADFVWMGAEPFEVRNKDVVSRCGWSPYDGWSLPRDVLATCVDGRMVYVSPKVS